MATQYITLADGTRIPVEGTRDYDAGTDYDFEGALNNAGYAALPGNMDWINKTYGTNFTPETYLQWVYGGGNVADTSAGQYFQTPNGVNNTVNTPLDYSPTDTDFGDLVKMGILGVAGAGLTGMLPGTTNVFSGLTGAGPLTDVPWGVNPQGGANILDGMDLSGYMTNFDTGPSFSGALTGSLAGNGLSVPPGATTAAQQAIDGSQQSTYDANANAGLPGYDPSLTSGAASGDSSNPFGGLDWTRILGQVAPSVLGYLGADKQADANKEMFEKFFGAGAPFRDLLLQSYKPGFDLNNEPGFKNAMDVGADTWARAASAGNAQGATGGNPYENPGSSIEGQKYLTGSLAMPYLTNYRSGLTGAGQLGLGPSVPFGQGAINAEGGKYDAIGYGLGELLNPKPQTGISIDPKTGQIKLNTGGSLV